MSTTKPAITISTRAAIQRINRKLRQDERQLFTARRDTMMESNVGRYYVVDVHYNQLVDDFINLETYGRELGVLHPWEGVADQE